MQRLTDAPTSRMEPARPSPTPTMVALAGAGALAVALGIGRFAFTPILPMMQEDVGLSLVAAGWLAAGNYLGYLAGALLAIWLPLRSPTAIRGGLAGIALATLGMALSSSPATWILLRVLAGVASAAVLIFVSAWALERLPSASRPAMVSVVFAGVGAGITVAGVVCLVVMEQRAGSAAAWIALGVLALVLTAAIWPVLNAPGGTADSPPGNPGDARPGEGERIRLILCYGAWGFGYIVPATFLPAMAREAVPDPLAFGWAWPIFGAASVAATLLAARGMRRLGSRRVWAASQATMGAGVLVPAVWPGMPAVVIAALLVGSTFMVNTMAGMQEARRVGGAGARVLMAAMTSAFAAGQIAGPAIVSTLDGDLRVSLLVAGTILILSAFVLRDHPKVASAPVPARSLRP